MISFAQVSLEWLESLSERFDHRILYGGRQHTAQEAQCFPKTAPNGRAYVIRTPNQVVLVWDLGVPQDLVKELRPFVEPQPVEVSSFKVDLQG